MFTFLIYSEHLKEPDTFWAAHHVAALWGLAVFFDLLVLMVLFVGVNALIASSAGSKAEAARRRLLQLAGGLRRIDGVVVLVAGVMVALLVSITFVSVIGRTLYKPIPDDITFAEWTMVALVALMLGTIQGREDHIEVTALSDIMSWRANLWLRFLGVLIGIAAVGRLTMIFFEEVPDSFLEITYGSIYELPGWPPRLIFMAGLAWWLARIAVQFLLLPAAIRTERHGDSEWFELWPLVSRTGTGEPEAVEALADGMTETNATGGARGT